MDEFPRFLINSFRFFIVKREDIMKKFARVFALFLVMTLILGQLLEVEASVDGMNIEVPVSQVQIGVPDISWYSSESDYFFISTAEQLAGLAQLVNNRVHFLDKTIYLVADIDISAFGTTNTDFNDGRGWIPIGVGSCSVTRALRYTFRGTFEGNNHSIAGLEIYSLDDEARAYVNVSAYIGLFGYINGTVQNLNLVDIMVIGHNVVGGLVGEVSAAGYVGNVSVTGTVMGVEGTGNIGTTIGGIAGSVSGRRSSSGITTSEREQPDLFYLDGLVENSNFHGVVVNEGNRGYAGGIAGRVSGGGLYRNYVIANISGGEDIFSVGGIVGWLSSSNVSGGGAVIYCYAIGEFQGWRNVGGIAGQVNDSVVGRCFAVGIVNNVRNGPAGGIAGNVSGSDSYIIFNAALNSVVIGGSGRTIGSVSVSNVPFVHGNVAFDGISNGAIANIFTAENGVTSITAAEIMNDGTLGGLFTEPNWVIENGKLPSFDRPIDIPMYLTIQVAVAERILPNGIPVSSIVEELADINTDGVFEFTVTESMIETAIDRVLYEAVLLQRPASGVYLVVETEPNRNVSAVRLTIEKSALNALENAGVSLCVNTPASQFMFTRNVISTLYGQADGDVVITVSPEEASFSRNYRHIMAFNIPIFSVRAENSSGGNAISNSHDRFNVSIPNAAIPSDLVRGDAEGHNASAIDISYIIDGEHDHISNLTACFDNWIDGNGVRWVMPRL